MPYSILMKWLCGLILFVTALSCASLRAEGLDQALLKDLRDGGLIIYFRHSATQWSQGDDIEDQDDLRSCDDSRMRQLSDAGRDLAREVGAAMRRLKIPVADVYSSEYCRCTETAELLNVGPVQTTRDILNVWAADHVGGREALKAKILTRFSTPPPAGGNTVLVAHGNVIVLAGGPRPSEAGAAIIQPRGKDNFTVITLIEPQEWIRFAEKVQP